MEKEKNKNKEQRTRERKNQQIFAEDYKRNLEKRSTKILDQSGVTNWKEPNKMIKLKN